MFKCVTADETDTTTVFFLTTEDLTPPLTAPHFIRALSRLKKPQRKLFLWVESVLCQFIRENIGKRPEDLRRCLSGLGFDTAATEAVARFWREALAIRDFGAPQVRHLKGADILTFLKLSNTLPELCQEAENQALVTGINQLLCLSFEGVGRPTTADLIQSFGHTDIDTINQVAIYLAGMMVGGYPTLSTLELTEIIQNALKPASTAKKSPKLAVTLLNTGIPDTAYQTQYAWGKDLSRENLTYLIISLSVSIEAFKVLRQLGAAFRHAKERYEAECDMLSAYDLVPNFIELLEIMRNCLTAQITEKASLEIQLTAPTRDEEAFAIMDNVVEDCRRAAEKHHTRDTLKLMLMMSITAVRLLDILKNKDKQRIKDGVSPQNQAWLGFGVALVTRLAQEL